MAEDPWIKKSGHPGSAPRWKPSGIFLNGALIVFVVVHWSGNWELPLATVLPYMVLMLMTYPAVLFHFMGAGDRLPDLAFDDLN